MERILEEAEQTLEELMDMCDRTMSDLPPDLVTFVKTEIVLERAGVGLSVSEMLREIQKEETNGKL